jgi:hypothetical protein
MQIVDTALGPRLNRRSDSENNYNVNAVSDVSNIRRRTPPSYKFVNGTIFGAGPFDFEAAPDLIRALDYARVMQRRCAFITANLDVIPEDKRSEKMSKAFIAADEANAEWTRLRGDVKHYEMWMKMAQDFKRAYATDTEGQKATT